MRIRINFKQNSSPKFNEIVNNCRKLNDFREDGENYTIEIQDTEIRPKRKLIQGVISRIKDWDDTEFYIDDKMTSSHELEEALQVRFCEFENQKKSPGERVCSEGEGWGCAQLKSVYYKNADRHPLSQKNWYDYGKFDKGDWLIDKKRIGEILYDEVKSKHIDECVLYSESNIGRVLDTLPSRINPDHDPNWEYRYRNANGVQEIVGIQPRKNTFNENPFSEFKGLFGSSNPFTGLFDAIKDLDIDGLGGSGNWNSPSGDSDFFSELFGDFSGGSSHSERTIPTTTFDDIGGMEKIIQQVKEVIELPIVAPELLEYYNIKPHKGILLYGPPGCGKTLLAKAVANEINAHFIPISGPEILNKYLGQSEENLRSIFKEALSKAPSIIYFDEFDSLATHRNQELDPYNSRVVNQILTLMDGMDDQSRICIIASTNRIDMIDEAIKRPGRFDYVLEISKPSLDGCKQIFNIYTEKMPIEPGFDKERFVSDYLFGCTGADIAFIATEAAYNSIRRTIDIDTVLNGRNYAVDQDNIIIEEDFLKAVETLEENRKNRQK